MDIGVIGAGEGGKHISCGENCMSRLGFAVNAGVPHHADGIDNREQALWDISNKYRKVLHSGVLRFHMMFFKG